jgi:hypothetical protein
MTVDRPLPIVLRLILIGAGVLAIVLPIRDLGWALWPPSLATVFFGIIIAGALAVGTLTMAFGLLGRGIHWRFPPGAVEIEARHWGRRRITRLTGADVQDLTVRHDADSDGPDRWIVCLATRSGELHETRGQPSPKAAEELALQIAAHLSVPFGPAA